MTVPIAELVSIGQEHTCSRSLFSFVNRNLNTLALRAHIIDSKGDLVLFKVERNESEHLDAQR